MKKFRIGDLHCDDDDLPEERSGTENKEEFQNVIELEEKRLSRMEIPDLYNMINADLDDRGLIERMRNNFAFKKALVLGWLDAVAKYRSAQTASYKDINALMMKSEAGFINNLEELGVHVDVASELSAEKLAEKPHIFLSTHQGGGLETYVLAELMRRGGVEDFRYVIKDELIGLPVVGKIIAGRKPILVSREKLKDEKSKELEIKRIGEEIVETLRRGENVLFFFEGTRSKSGAIAHTDNRKAWCRKLTAAIETAAEKYPGLEYGKALVVLDMLSVLPVAVEKELTATVRTNGDCTVKIVDADDLSITENPDDIYDRKTLFGKARTTLKEMLMRRINRNRNFHTR